jgi:hypothetical protein
MRGHAVVWLVFAAVAGLLLSACGGGTVSAPEPPAFEASVGTANYTRNATPSTAFGTFVFYVFRLKNPAPSGGIDVVVRGPAGWNNGQPLTLPNEWLQERRGAWWDWWAFGTGTTGCDGVRTFDCRAVSGRYTVEATVEGKLYSVVVDVDASKFLPTTTAISGSSTTSSVSVSWTAVADARMYEMAVRRASDLSTLVRRASVDTSATAAVALDASTQYVVDLRSFSFNASDNPPTLPGGQVNWSRLRSQPFLPGQPITTAAAAAAQGAVPAGEREWGRLGR